MDDMNDIAEARATELVLRATQNPFAVNAVR